jgi:DNA-binding MarR family transcriptional regulator
MDGEVMSDNSFFKPTLLYKEFMILDLIEKDANITQREISKTIGVAVSMVNQYIENFVEKGLIKKKKHSTKTVEYFVTRKGLERKKLLNIGYLKNSQILYDSARENIEKFLNQLEIKGKKKLFLYGAGEVAEILLHTIYSSDNTTLTILGVIDDDINKVGSFIYNTPIFSLDIVKNQIHDGILISSYTNKNSIIRKLNDYKYDVNKIYNFFDL